MKYAIVEDEDILNADVIMNYIYTYDNIWHADYYIVRIPTLSKKDMAYIYGLFDNDECLRIKNMCLVTDDKTVVVVIDISQYKDDIVLYISDVVYMELSKMGCLCDKDATNNN